MGEPVHSMAIPITDAELAEVKAILAKPEYDGVGDYIAERLIARIEINTHTIASQASKLALSQNALANERIQSKSMEDIAGEFAKRDSEIERLRQVLKHVTLCMIEEKPTGPGTGIPPKLSGWIKDLETMVHASQSIAYDALQIKMEGE